MKRREFARIAGIAALAAGSFPMEASFGKSNGTGAGKGPVPIGVANHSLRSLQPDADELIDFAIQHKLDSVQFNTLRVFKSFDEDYLAKLKSRAEASNISIYVGVGSISESSVRFTDFWGDARTLVETGMKTAIALGSPILGVRIGILDDRYTEGGIEPKMEEVVRLMRSFRGPVSDAGIKFAFENHAGDMRSEELLVLIGETGKDICGAFFDPGNAIYAMEDPAVAMESLGSLIICSQARDVMIWSTEDGAIFQWTAIGEGLMDFNHYTNFLAENCPGVPIHIETISNSPRPVPFLKPGYWAGWPDLRASGMVDFLKLVRRGAPIGVAKVPEGMDKKAFEIENQKSELLRSVEYLRQQCGAGVNV